MHGNSWCAPPTFMGIKADYAASLRPPSNINSCIKSMLENFTMLVPCSWGMITWLCWAGPLRMLLQAHPLQSLQGFAALMHLLMHHLRAKSFPSMHAASKMGLAIVW